jgi:hypothetical protein
MQLAAVRDIAEQEPGGEPAAPAVFTVVFFAAGRGIEAALMAIFAALAWVAGVCWRIVADITMAVEYGFRSGAGWPQRSPEDEEPSPES